MNKAMFAAVSTVAAISCALTAVPASAQNRHDDRGHHEDRGDRNDRDQHRWNNYGGGYGYNGYRGQWRTGQRYPGYRGRQGLITDYRAYNLPAPRRGYRYYRDSHGDIVSVAIASGLIGAILGSAIANGR